MLLLYVFKHKMNLLGMSRCCHFERLKKRGTFSFLLSLYTYSLHVFFVTLMKGKGNSLLACFVFKMLYFSYEPQTIIWMSCCSGLVKFLSFDLIGKSSMIHFSPVNMLFCGSLNGKCTLCKQSC